MSDLLAQINQHDLTVTQLKDELRSRGAKLTGNKSELEDRLRFILTTGTVITTQKGKKRADRLEPSTTTTTTTTTLPKSTPVIPPRPNPNLPQKLDLPSVPKTVPKIGPKIGPKVGSQPSLSVPTKMGQPIAPKRIPPSSSPSSQMNPHLQSIDRLKFATFKEQLTVDQLKRELQAIGIQTSGTKKELQERLFTYLSSISLLDPVKWAPITVSSKNSPEQIGPIFDQAWERTTEGVMQSLEPNDPVSFYDNDAHTYHSFMIRQVKRSPFGLVDELVLEPSGYSLIRYNNQWTLFYQPQAGRLNQARTFPVSIAARMFIS